MFSDVTMQTLHHQRLRCEGGAAAADGDVTAGLSRLRGPLPLAVFRERGTTAGTLGIERSALRGPATSRTETPDSLRSRGRTFPRFLVMAPVGSTWSSTVPARGMLVPAPARALMRF